MKDTIIFDLDGTLVDSLGDIADAANYALESLNYKKRSLEEIKSFIGNGADVLIKKALPDCGQSDFERAMILFKKHYNANICKKTKPYDGIIELLDYLKSNSYKVGIATNKPDDSARLIGNKLFKNSVDIVAGASPDRRKKPEADSVDYCIKCLNSKRENVIYVGDSEVDVKTAKNSGVICIGVTWGFRSIDFLEGADYIANDVSQLKKIIAAL